MQRQSCSRHEDNYYNMNHKKRGVALIFHHVHFDNPQIQSLESDDCKIMKNALEKLEFEVHVLRDLTKAHIEEVLITVAEIDHSDHDCLWITVLTHGGIRDSLCAFDQEYRSDMLTEPFTADRCRSLAGKPKLFFFDACRGSKSNTGVDMPDDQPSLLQMHSKATNSIPIDADFFFFHATTPGNVSWMEGQKLSWFTQTLVEVMTASDFHFDWDTLCTAVRAKVAEYEILESGKPMKKQMPQTVNTLTKTLKFERKNKE